MPPTMLTRIVCLYCGQGMAALMEVYNSGIVDNPDYLALFDFGGNDAEARDVEYVRKKVEERGNLLDGVFISHRDKDHHVFLLELGKAMARDKSKISQLWVGGTKWEKWEYVLDTFKKAVGFTKATFHANDGQTSYPKADHRYLARNKKDDESVEIRVLISNAAPGANASSAIFVIDNGAFSAILPGDATFQTMEKVNQLYKDVRSLKREISKILLFEAPHHGSLSSSVPKLRYSADLQDQDTKILAAFATRMSARNVVASAGFPNTYRHPTEELLQFFAKQTRAVPLHNYCSFNFTKEIWRNQQTDQAIFATIRKAPLKGGIFNRLGVQIVASKTEKLDEGPLEFDLTDAYSNNKSATSTATSSMMEQRACPLAPPPP